MLLLQRSVSIMCSPDCLIIITFPKKCTAVKLSFQLQWEHKEFVLSQKICCEFPLFQADCKSNGSLGSRGRLSSRYSFSDRWTLQASSMHSHPQPPTHLPPSLPLRPGTAPTCYWVTQEDSLLDLPWKSRLHLSRGDGEQSWDHLWAGSTATAHPSWGHQWWGAT